MRNFKLFFFIFFVFIFPLLLEITNLDNRNMETLVQRKADYAIAYLVLGVVLWVFVLYDFFSRHIYTLIIQKTSLKRIFREGIQRRAEVIRKEILTFGNRRTAMNLKLSFKNFHNHPIEIDYCFVPHNKYLTSFQKGEVIAVYMDRKLRPPYLYIEGAGSGFSIRNIWSQFFLLLILVLYAVFLFVGSFYFQSKGMGWRFLHFFHPWILVPLLSFIVFKLNVLFQHDFHRFKKLQDKQYKVLFSGRPANAQVVKAVQTDEHIFSESVVKYEVKFLTSLNEWYEASILKTVAASQLYNIEHSPRKILYMPEDPSQAAFIDKTS